MVSPLGVFRLCQNDARVLIQKSYKARSLDAENKTEKWLQGPQGHPDLLRNRFAAEQKELDRKAEIFNSGQRDRRSELERRKDVDEREVNACSSNILAALHDQALVKF
jgi:hypothetical protein